MKMRVSGKGFTIAGIVTLMSIASAVVYAAEIGPQKINREQWPEGLFTRADTATCVCDGIPFSATCPGNQKVTCKCQPPGYSCSN